MILTAKTMHRLTGVLAVLALAACASAPPNPNPRAAQPLALASKVELDRFMGRWYVIANVPYFAERGFVGSYVEYTLRPDGRIDDVYFGRKGSFEKPVKNFRLTDTVVANTGNAKWKASPFWPVKFDFLILDVDADYQTALIGYPGKKLGWIFARRPMLDDTSYQRLLGKLDAQGYDTTRLRKVPQSAAQVGQPGFQ